MKTKKNVFFTWNMLRFLKHDIKSTMREKMIIYWTILKLETSDQNLNTGNTKCWWEYGEWELSFIVDGNAKWCSHSEDNLVVTYKAKYAFSVQCNSHAPWYLSKEADRSFSSTKTCIWIFMTAIFTIANTWKQPKCPSVGEWIICDISRQWNIT